MEKRLLAVTCALALVLSVVAQPISAEASTRTELIIPERVTMYNIGPTSVDVNGYATNQSAWGASGLNYEYPSSLGWQSYGVRVKEATIPTETRFIYTFSDEDLVKLRTADSIKVTVTCEDVHAYGASWANPDDGLSTPSNTGIHVGISLVTWKDGINVPPWKYDELYMGTNAFESSRPYLHKIEPKEFEGKFDSVKGISVWTMMSKPPANGNDYIQISGTADILVTVELTYDTGALGNNQLTNIGNTLGNIATNLENGVGAITGNQNTMIQQNQTIIQKIQAGFESIGDSVEQGVTNAVNKLFVPEQADVEQFMLNMQTLEEEHLAPIAQVKMAISAVENSLLNPDYNAQLSGDLAQIGGYLNQTQGDGVFIFPAFEMSLPEGDFTLWEAQTIDVGATLNDLRLGWIPTVTKAICSALFTWRFLIMVLRWLMKMTDNPTFGHWADMLATFDFEYRPSW